MGQHMDNIYHSHNPKSFCMCFWQGSHSNSNIFLDISRCIDKVLDNHKLICKLEHHCKYFCSKDIWEILILDLQLSRLRILWILLDDLYFLHLNCIVSWVFQSEKTIGQNNWVLFHFLPTWMFLTECYSCSLRRQI